MQTPWRRRPPRRGCGLGLARQAPGGAPHRRRDRRGARVLTLLIGHRGTRTKFTENTLEAIEEAARCGAAGVEIDVRLCRTGEVVVMHDQTLKRVTDGADQRSVASMTLDALREVVLPHGEHIPTLDEVLDLCAYKELLLNVEVKRDVPSRIRATLAVARTLVPTRCEVVVSSFDPFMLTGVAALAPRVPLALLLSPDHTYMEPVASWLRCVAIHPAHDLVHARAVRRWQSHGLRVNTWTVNDAERARDLLTLGVDGIITDDPETLRPLFG